MEIDKNHSPNQDTQNATVSDDKMQAWIPTKNPPALISYYAGIFGLLPFLGLPATIVAIVLGIIAVKKNKQHPTPGAKVHALIGLGLGIFQMLVLIGFIILSVIQG